MGLLKSASSWTSELGPKPKSKRRTIFRSMRNFPRRCLSKLKLLMRHLRLHIMTQLLSWKQDQERPQIALFRSRWLALLFTIPHLLPLTGALVLVVFNIYGVLVTKPSSTVQTALQFLAKLFELLLQASLATMLLGVVRLLLLRDGEPLALGMLAAPMRTTDFSYLWSLDFWGATTSPSTRRSRTLLLCVSVALVYLLAALVGPSGAVLLIPRPITLKAPGQWSFYLDNRASLFPRVVDYFNADLFAQSASALTNFPAATVTKTDEYIQLADIAGSRVMTTRRSLNQTFLRMWHEGESPLDVVGISSIPDHRMLRVFAAAPGMQLDPGFFPSTMVPTFEAEFAQPVVRSSCFFHNNFWVSGQGPGTIFYPGNNSNISYPFEHLFMPDHVFFNTSDGISGMMFSPWPLGQATQHSATLTWGTKSTQSVTSSTGTNSSMTSTEIMACVIDAVRLEARMKFATNTWLLSSSPHESMTKALRSHSPLSFSESWTSAVRSAFFKVWNGTFTGFANDPYTWRPDQAIALALSDSGPEYPVLDYQMVPGKPQTLEPAQDQISYDGSFFNYDYIWGMTSSNLTTSSLTTNINNFTEVIVSQRYAGTGYDSATLPVRLSLAVILSYCVLVVIYLIWTLYTGNVGNSWDSVSDLVMLALNSRRPTHLGSISVGAETIKTFQQPVNIRVNNENSLELVFVNAMPKEGDGMKLVEANKEY